MSSKKIEYVLDRKAKKVLIIEDNPKHAKALAYFLETFNINSELESDVNAGIDALKRKEVDCVILDMGIPDSKAYDMLEEARRTPGLGKLTDHYLYRQEPVDGRRAENQEIRRFNHCENRSFIPAYAG